jgi:ankyrin repeat protein
MLKLMSCCALLLVAGSAMADDARALVLAARLDNPSSVKSLLARGASPNAIDPISGEPVLVAALRENSSGAAAVLLANQQINLELRAPNGNTALMMAAFKGNKVFVAALLARGALVNQKGWAALHYAAAGGHADIAALLLDKHASIDAESPGRQTPLMIAAREGHEAVVDLLLKEGADARLANTDGQTAAQLALSRDKPRIAQAIGRHLAAKP